MSELEERVILGASIFRLGGGTIPRVVFQRTGGGICIFEGGGPHRVSSEPIGDTFGWDQDISSNTETVLMVRA